MSWAMGVDTVDLSTADYTLYQDTEINWAVREGLGAVVARAARGLDVVLDCPVLVIVFFGGAYARELEEARALEAVARDELIRLFGSDLGGRIRRTTATAWLGDPWARGSYSAARPGFARCRGVLAEPVADRVFFAGEACTPTAYGAIHGAWASGVDAAHRVVSALTRDAARR